MTPSLCGGRKKVYCGNNIYRKEREGEEEEGASESDEERIFLFISSILREFDLRLKSILFLRRLALPSRGQVFSLSSMVRLRSPHDGTILEGN